MIILTLSYNDSMSFIAELFSIVFTPAMLATILGMLAVLVANEWWWHGKTHGELSRKFVHLTIGTFVAFWPLYLSWTQIQLLSLAFVFSVLVSQYFQVFRAIHSAQRPTWGEVFFGVAVGLTALMTHQPAIYAVALLHMSLADGLAAIVGTNYGRSNSYKILGMHKSVVGTATFALVSLLLLITFGLYKDITPGLWLPLAVLGSTLMENVAVKGLDNLLVPVFVAVVLGLVI